MNSNQQNKVPSRRQPNQPDPDAQRAGTEEPDDRDTAEEVIHESRTAQDREHTIRRGDSTTSVTKEFPT
jgi:hypothetical protein